MSIPTCTFFRRIAMKDATLAQGNGVLNLILQKRTPASQIQTLFGNGLLAAVLDANLDSIDDEAMWQIMWLLGHRWKAMEIVRKHFPSSTNRRGICSCCGRELQLIPNPWHARLRSEVERENYLVPGHGREVVGCPGNFNIPGHLI